MAKFIVRVRYIIDGKPVLHEQEVKQLWAVGFCNGLDRPIEDVWGFIVPDDYVTPAKLKDVTVYIGPKCDEGTHQAWRDAPVILPDELPHTIPYSRIKTPNLPLGVSPS